MKIPNRIAERRAQFERDLQIAVEEACWVLRNPQYFEHIKLNIPMINDDYATFIPHEELERIDEEYAIVEADLKARGIMPCFSQDS